jgi:hypothetical protein
METPVIPSDTTQKRIAIAIAFASDATTMRLIAVASQRNSAARRENLTSRGAEK